MTTETRQLNPLSMSYGLSSDPIIKLLVFGDPKTRKTSWVGEACNQVLSGRRVFYLDCDHGGQILTKSLKREVLDRVTYINLSDQPDYNTIIQFITRFFIRSLFWYDTATGMCFDTLGIDAKKAQANGTLVEVDSRNLDPKDIVIMDSLTAYCNSMFNQANRSYKYEPLEYASGKDLKKDTQSYYQTLSREFGIFTNTIHNLPCSLLMISHTKNVRKFDGKGDLMWEKTYPFATTTNASELLASYFNEVLYMELRGTSHYVNAQSSTSLIGVGGRVIEPKQYTYNELSIGKVLELYGFKTVEPYGDDRPVARLMEQPKVTPTAFTTTTPNIKL